MAVVQLLLAGGVKTDYKYKLPSEGVKIDYNFKSVSEPIHIFMDLY